MGSPKLLLNIGLILATAIVFCIADYSKVKYRLPNNALPNHYNISLVPRLEESNSFFHGEINVVLHVHSGLSPNITLHSQELEIDESATTLQWLNITLSGLTYVPFKPKEHIYNSETNTLTLTFNDNLWLGAYVLSMKFFGHFSEKDDGKGGFIKFLHTDEKRNNSILAVTYFEPNKARRVFPCWDEPAFKATFKISVLHHQNHTVLSNMPIQEQFEDKDNMTWTHFSATRKMSTYLVGIVIISNFDHISNTDKTVLQHNLWYKPSLRSKVSFAHTIAQNVTPLLDEYTTISLPVPKIDHVMVHDYPAIGMGNWGLIFYEESEIIYSEEENSLERKAKIAQIVIHELLHQWFGNLVTPSWWSHLWLSEGFATYFNAYFLNKIYAESRRMDFFVVKTVHKSFRLDTGIMDPIIFERDMDELVSFEVHDKAPVILRMLHQSLSEGLFRNGLNRYLTLKKFGSATSDDFWYSMQQAINSSFYLPFRSQGINVKEVMNTWINQSYYPILNVIRNDETGEVTITQKPFRGTNNKWWIPITLARQRDLDFSKTVANHWLGPDQNITFHIDLKEWIIVNVQQTAYCRVNYDRHNWRKLAHYLNSEAYINIHVLNRAQIIDDAFALMYEGKIEIDLFYNITSYLSRERDYVAWYPIFQIISRFSAHFRHPESQTFKDHMKSIFHGLLQNIGYEESPDDDHYLKILRQKTLEWVCSMDDAECKRKAAIKLNEYLDNPDTYIIPESLKDWTYCSGLMTANLTTFNRARELYQYTYDQKLYEGLTCVENPTIIVFYLNSFTKSSNSTSNAVKKYNDENERHVHVFKTILRKHVHIDSILDHILENLEIIKPRLLTSFSIIMDIISNVYLERQLNKVKSFAETNFHGNSLTKIHTYIEIRKTNFKQAVDVINVRLRSRD